MINRKPCNIRYFFNPDHHPDSGAYVPDEATRIRWRLEEIKAEEKRLNERLQYLNRNQKIKQKQR
ncbi:MAG: hypothetical protein J6S12_01270 [Alphaproteobacteria bacterium]|nr:hypothetical protein [Alphaproteobacteria bacterium]